MTKALHSEKKKRCLGLILEMLKANRQQSGLSKVEPVDLLVIQSVLKLFGHQRLWGELTEELKLLERKGYVQVIIVEMAGVKGVLVDLRTYGLGLFDGSVSDEDILLSQ